MSSNFDNPPLDVAAHPVLGDEHFVPLHPNLLRASLIGRAIFAAVVTIIGVAVAIVSPETLIPLAVMAVVLALVGVSTILRIVEVNHIAYQVREHDLSHRHGVITRTVSTLPFVRVQHARIRRGPIERRFGMATLQVNSAGANLSIQGLGDADAERIKALVVDRAGELIEDG